MSRYTICWEGYETVPGQFLEPDSIQFPDEKYPFTWSFGRNVNDLLGHATNVRREDDGRLTAELYFNDTDNGQNSKALLEHHDVGATIWANEVMGKREEGTWFVSSCRLREVALSTSVPWRDPEWTPNEMERND